MTAAPRSGMKTAMSQAQFLFFGDVSERRRTERALVSAERKSRHILESISDAFFLLDKEWRFSQLNATAEELMGLPATDLLGKIHWEQFPATLGTQVETL